MLDRADRGAGICKLMGCVRVFVPFPLEAVDFVVEIWVIDVDFMGVDADDRPCE